jgi:hypothetical protein
MDKKECHPTLFLIVSVTQDMLFSNLGRIMTHEALQSAIENLLGL